MRIVLDTNVVVSGILYGGIPGTVLETVIQDNYQVILSAEIKKSIVTL